MQELFTIGIYKVCIYWNNDSERGDFFFRLGTYTCSIELKPGNKRIWVDKRHNYGCYALLLIVSVLIVLVL